MNAVMLSHSVTYKRFSIGVVPRSNCRTRLYRSSSKSIQSKDNLSPEIYLSLMLNLLLTRWICIVLKHRHRHTQGNNSKGRTDFYPAFLKKLFSSSHLCIGKHPWVKPNMSEVLWTKGVQDCRLSSVPYVTLSCKVPPNLIFNGEKAAQHSEIRSNDT